MNKISLTISGLVVLIISEVLRISGFTANPEEITTFLDVSLKLIGAGMVWWGRIRVGGINLFGIRR